MIAVCVVEGNRTVNNQERSDRKMGECRVCGRSFMLVKDGSVWTHARKRERWMNCSGSGQLPVAASSGGVS